MGPSFELFETVWACHVSSRLNCCGFERGVPSRLLSVDDDVSNAVIHLATDRTLAGRILLWWSEDYPRLIRWGDRGYKDADAIVLKSAS
jgi:hypothetical protein